MSAVQRQGQVVIARTVAAKDAQEDLIQVLDENGTLIAKMYWTGKMLVTSGFDIYPSVGTVELAIINGNSGTPFQLWNAGSGAYMFRFTNSDLEIRGLKVKEGTNQRMGTATLVAGTVTVNNTAVTTNSRIFLTAQNASGTAGELGISARTAGTSFTITSTSNTDTRQVAYLIMEPGTFL